MNTLITCCVIALLAAPAANAAPEQRFAEAQALFEAAQDALAQPGGDPVAARKQFYDAALRFAALVDEGIRSANLYLNTGNAFHFAGDDARALLWYLRANRLSSTVETRDGLITLRQACNAEQWPPEQGSIGRALMFWHTDLSQPLKQWIFLACYPLGCLIVVVMLLGPRRSAWLRLGVALMIIGGTIGISDLVAAAQDDGSWAVVLEQARGYAGDGQGYSVVVDEIRPGQEVRLIESRQAWLRVKLPSESICWLPAEVCERV